MKPEVYIEITLRLFKINLLDAEQKDNRNSIRKDLNFSTQYLAHDIIDHPCFWYTVLCLHVVDV